jgi:hypothetical protein
MQTTTWLKTKNRIKNILQIETDAEFEADYLTKVIDATNDALIQAYNDFPRTATLTITQAESIEDGYNKYDIPALALAAVPSFKFNGFIEYCRVLKNDTIAGLIAAEHRVFNNQYVYLRKTDDGEFIVNCKVELTEITSSTADNFIMELDFEVMNILPLLIASIIQLEEEPDLSSENANDYRAKINELISKKPNIYDTSIKVQMSEEALIDRSYFEEAFNDFL